MGCSVPTEGLLTCKGGSPSDFRFGATVTQGKDCYRIGVLESCLEVVLKNGFERDRATPKETS